MGIQLEFKENSTYNILSDIRDFRREVLRGIQEICGPEFEVTERDAEKNNGIILCGISISGKEDSVAPTIYLESLHEEYLRGTMNIREVENEIVRVYSREKCNMHADLSYFTDFERVKDKITFRLINAGRNKGLLSDAPHRIFLDLAVVYTVYVDNLFAGAGNVVIRNDLMDKWDTDEESLYRLAVRNTPKIKGPVIRDMAECLAELMADKEGYDPGIAEELKNSGGISMYIITNSDKYFGSAAVLYPGLLSDIREKLGTDYYLLPSSVHEFIAVPCTDNTDEAYLTDMVRSVNISSVGKEDYLSDNIYVFRDGIMDMV